MAAPLWRMNGVWRRMAGVLVLCALLLSNEVMCQDETIPTAPAAEAGDAADASVALMTDAAGTAAPPDVTAAPGVGADATDAAGGESTTSAVPGDSLLPFTIRNIDINADNQDGGASGTIIVTDDKPDKGVSDVPAEVPNNSPDVKVVVPEVTCVGQDNLSGKQYVEVEVKTADCEESKRIIMDNPANWCENQNCRLSLHQNGNRLMVSSDDAQPSALADVLQSNHMRDKLTKAPASSSSGSSVFVGILVSGLLAAIAITVGYFKCQRRSDTKGVRLAEEGHPVDQENQGNTLVSVAPLNPPPETQEKPSVNGESPEAAKTQDLPPTNGHSTAKTADTEM